MSKALFAIALLLASSAFAQISTSTTSTQSASGLSGSPVRDPQTLSMLQQALALAGGTPAIAAIQDFSASGTITYNSPGQAVSGPVQLQGRGVRQLRLDAQMDDGRHSMMIDGGTGSFVNPTSSRTITALNSGNLAMGILPLIHIAKALEDPRAAFFLIGTTPEIRIRLIRGMPQGLARDERLKKIKGFEVVLDPMTSTVLAVRHAVFPREGRSIEIIRELRFSDYRQVNGVSVPFTIQERMGEQLTWTIRLSTVALNVGIPASAFQP